MGVDSQEIEESKESTIVRKLDLYEESINKNTIFFSPLSPQEIFHQLKSKLQDENIMVELSDKKWKLSYKRFEELDQQEKELEMQPDWCQV